MPQRLIPPPDFRYVGLTPGLSPATMAAAAAGASTSLAGMLLLATGPDTASLVVSLLAGGLAALTLGRRGAFQHLRLGKAQPVAMAIVPWGVLIRPDEEGEARVLRWSGVRSVSVDCIHTRDVNGSPHTTWSFVTIETARERLQGRAAGAAPLERLVAHLEAYAHESSLPLALDLAGSESVSEPGFEPSVRPLLGRARAYLATGDGAEALSLRSGSYRRQTNAWTPSDETLDLLRGVLREVPAGEADRRAFAALVTGEIGARALVPELLRLVTTAHPLVAATAKAAALRLGCDPTKAGALLEVAPFLHEDDLEALHEWLPTPAAPAGPTTT